jgi:hypothetical protein
MERDLAQLDSLAGVGGSFVLGAGGEVIATSKAAPLAATTMNRVGRLVGQMLAVIGRAGRPAERLDLRFDSWRLLAQDFGNGLLLVVCEPHVDMAMLKLTADVVIPGWTQDAAAQKRLQVAPRVQVYPREGLDDTVRRLLNQST